MTRGESDAVHAKASEAFASRTVQTASSGATSAPLRGANEDWVNER